MHKYLNIEIISKIHIFIILRDLAKYLPEVPSRQPLPSCATSTLLASLTSTPFTTPINPSPSIVAHH